MQVSVSTIVAAAVFVLLALTNVALMLDASSPSRSSTTKNRLIVAHRVTGYAFVMLFCVMVYTMSQRLAGLGITKNLPTYLVVHIVLALSLAPLLLLKIVIARFYKQSYSSLRPLGMAIFVVSFVAVSIPTFSAVVRSVSPGSLGMKLATGFFICFCLVQCGLILRSATRPGRVLQTARPPEQPQPEISLRNDPNTAAPMTLLLSQVEQQTHDAKTLRFLVPKERPLRFKPGQFLTFRWTINGQRVPRSYTISSSPTRSNYIEITPKRMENGCVSVFLNDEAKPGLTVEASGPYGTFCFDEAIHHNLIFLAAGSGITPMMSMLRYIDDLRLSPSVALLYFVRTRNDVIFAKELDALSQSLPNFKYSVCLSQPDKEWPGDSGHLNEQLLLKHVPDLQGQTFFLCGPKGFMDGARQILAALGVDRGQIAQESFGEKNRSADAPSSERVTTIVFSLSQKVCQDRTGCSLLELAEGNGVQIPFGCRQGMCGTCATRLLNGAVHMHNEAGLSPEQKEAGYVLPCVSRAEGTIVIAA